MPNHPLGLLAWGLALILAGALALRVVALWLTCKEVLRLRYLPGGTRLIAEAELPEGLRQDWASELAAWEALGFAPTAWLESQAPMQQSDRRFFQALLQRPGEATTAFVHPAMLPQAARPAHATLATPRADGWRLESLNGLSPFIAGQQHQVLWHDEGLQAAPTLLAQHQGALVGFLGPQGQAPLWPPEAWAEALDASNRRYPSDLAAQGLALPCPDGSFRLRWGVALKQSLRLLRHQRAWHQAPPGQALEGDEAGLATEANAYMRWRAEQEAQSSPWARSFVFLASALLFALALRWSGLVPELHAIWTLTAVLALHELGHFVAMWALGYRQTGVVFVPILGAFTHGQPPPGPPGQRELIVVFAGPLPGLLLGSAALVAHHLLPGPWPSWWREATALLLALNLFNMLPIWPMDGGRILALLLPEGSWLARGLSLVGGLALAYLFRGQAWVAGLMLATTVVLPWAWRQEGRLRALLAARVEGPLEDEVLALFRALRRPPFPALGYAEKHHWVRLALRAPEATRLGLGARLAWGAAYGIGLLGPLALLFAFLPGLRPHF